MKTSNFKEMSLIELQVKGRDLRQEMFNFKILKATSRLEKPALLKVIRRNIARIETQISIQKRTTVA